MENLQKHIPFTSSSNNPTNSSTTNNNNNNNSNNTAAKSPAPDVATMGLNPGGGQRSVFHVKVDHNFYSEEEIKHRENLRNYKEMHQKFDEAGSRLADAFANSLKDTVHDGFAKKCNAVLGSVFGGNSPVTARINELSNMLSGVMNKLDTTKEQEEKQMSYNQVMLKCLLLFLKIQQDYHNQCTEAISSFIQSVNQQSSTDLLSLLGSLDITTTGQPTQPNVDFISLQSGRGNNNNNNNNITNVNHSSTENKTELKSEATASSGPAAASLSKTVTDCNLRSAGSNGQTQNKLSSMPSTCPSPSSSSSSSLSSSSSVFSSSLEPSFSLFTKLNALYIPIGQTAGQSMDTNNVPSTTAAAAAAVSSSSSAASTVLTSDSQGPSHWPKAGVQPLVGAIGNNEKGASTYVKGSAGKANGQLASEEELDSVINLLSGGMVLSQPPPAPPPPQQQQQPQSLHMPNQLQPSPLLHAPPAGGPMFGTMLTSSDAEEQHKMYRANAHRRSEGSLDLSGMTTLNSGGGPGGGASSSGGGRNTWPHPNHHHRSSLPAGPLGSHPLLNYDPQQQPSQEDYPRMIDSTGSLDQRGSLSDVYLPAACHPRDLQSGLYSLPTCPPTGGNFMTNSPWTFPDNKLNRTWPVSSLSTGGGSDTMNSSWSGVQDSSDLSDDSSSGEQFFAVGLDLVHAMDSKDSSSDEDGDQQHLEGRMRAPMVSQSLENLYDRKSTYTWPPKHPWARRSDLVLNSPELECTVSTPAATGSATPSLPSSGPWTADPLQPPRNMWAPGMPNQSQSSQSLSHQSYGTLQ